MFLCGMNLWRDLWLDNGWVWCMYGWRNGLSAGNSCYWLGWILSYDVAWIL